MSGEIGKDAASEKAEHLQSTAMAVQEMVREMQKTKMEFEEDLNDPLEQAMVVKEKSKPERPKSAEGNRQSASRGYGRGSRKYHCFRGYGGKSQYSSNDEGTNQDMRRPSSASFEEPRLTSKYSSDKQYWSNNNRFRGRGRRGAHSSASPRHENLFLDRQGSQVGIDACELVKILSESSSFSSSLLQLMETRNLNPSNVREVVSSNGHIFELRDETVVLCPKIQICKDHSGSQGCQNQSACNDLHVCLEYLTSWCQVKNCVLGHRWFTDHNKHVLNLFYIREVPVQNLRKLLQSVIVSAGGTGQIDICKDYNGMGCNKQDCSHLHICHSFVTGRTKCTLPGCQLNHNILASECSQLLIKHGISINETPRDVVMALINANPTLKKAPPQIQDSNKSSEVKHNGDGAVAVATATSSQKQSMDNSSSGSANTSSQKQSHDSSSSGSSNKSVYDSKKLSNKEKGDRRTINLLKSKVLDPSSSKKSKTEQKTLWSHEYEGTTVISEICYYSVESRCRNERNGCLRLHSSLHYHWQISENGSSWLNLSRPLVETLEYAFCNVEKDEVTLPRLDPGKLESSLKGIFTLMGRDEWKANFSATILYNSDCSKVMYLRRLCTETINGQDIPACRYQWYFLDKNNKWVEYGNVDTAGETNLVSSVTSGDIEKHYCTSSDTPLNFRNSSYNYKIDFNTMKQTNQNTNVSREVRRRPVQHLKPVRKQMSSTSDLPDTWQPMQPQERVRLITLSSSSQEYQNVLALCGGINIIKVERIQNPYLYKAFQNKIKEMTSVYGSLQKVDVRQLFHGTRPDVISNICAENFDWRLHGTSSGQYHGQGTYFSPNISTSLGYCSNDRSGYRYLFIARVAVGSVTQGNSSMARPPINPSTGFPFDSTGDGVSVVVKYDKQEYYPEYIITLS